MVIVVLSILIMRGSGQSRKAICKVASTRRKLVWVGLSDHCCVEVLDDLWPAESECSSREVKSRWNMMALFVVMALLHGFVVRISSVSLKT